MWSVMDWWPLQVVASILGGSTNHLLIRRLTVWSLATAINMPSCSAMDVWMLDWKHFTWVNEACLIKHFECLGWIRYIRTSPFPTYLTTDRNSECTGKDVENEAARQAEGQRGLWIWWGWTCRWPTWQRNTQSAGRDGNRWSAVVLWLPTTGSAERQRRTHYCN